MLTIDEAKKLKVGDALKHVFLHTKWVVSDIRKFKSNSERVDLVLKNGAHAWKVKNKQFGLIERI